MDIKQCAMCHAILRAGAKFCSKCGASVSKRSGNYCENPTCVRCMDKYIFDDSDRYCDKCGKLTTVGREIEDLI